MRLPTLCLLLAGLLLLICSQPAAAANTYTVQVGFQAIVDNIGVPAWYGEFFYPDNLTIAYGDSVTFYFATVEVHNVVFSNNNESLSEMNAQDTAFAPPAGPLGPSIFTDPTDVYDSGISTLGAPNYTLTFTPQTGSGSFLYYCTIHKPAMAAYINVLPQGQTAPLDPAAALAEAQAQIAFDVSQAQLVQTQLDAAAATATGSDVPHSSLSDGSILWSVQGGAMTMFPSTVYGVPMYMRWLPTYLEVHEGDTVEWTMDGNGMGPHTVVFEPDNSYVFVYGNYTQGTVLTLADEPYVTTRLAPLIIGFGAQGPIFDKSTHTDTVPSAALVDSGLIFPVDEDALVPFPSAYRVHFTAEGSYNYSCSLHQPMGMIGQVVVKPLGSPLCTIPGDAASCDSLVQSSGGVLGDPTIIGLRGQKFQVHGLDGAVYSLLTHPRLQLNGRFSFLASGRCPADRSILCWSHPGSYISSVGLMLRAEDGSVTQLEVHSGAAADGLQSVKLNGRLLNAAETVQTGRGRDELSVHRVDSHHVLVRTEMLTLHIESSDGFLNHRVEPRVQLSSLKPMHGIIGQTWQDVQHQHSEIKEMEGMVDDYLVQENTLFGSQFPFNQW